MEFPVIVQKIFDAIPDSRLVGGCVRDTIANKPIHDYDMAAPYSPEVIAEKLTLSGFNIHETGIKHGTITVTIDGESVEITSLRSDLETDGRHAVVEWTTDWKTDAERRDFTINAMSIDKNGIIHDYFNGQEHLMSNIVRFVGDPNKRIQEDFLRILRWFRFQARFGKTVDQDAIDAIRVNAIGLKIISRERIWMEMSKIISGPNAVKMIDMINNLDLNNYIDFRKINTSDLAAAINHGITDPVSLIVAYISGDFTLDNDDEIVIVKKLAENWKWSNQEKDRALGIMKITQGSFSLKEIKALLVDGFPREWVIDAFKIGQFVGLEEITNWKIPVFPISGKHLIAMGMKPGPEMGKKLNELKQEWLMTVT